MPLELVKKKSENAKALFCWRNCCYLYSWLFPRG